MTKQISTILLTGLFFIGQLTELKAQDKYEFAAVSYYLADKNIIISIGGKEVKTVSVEKEEAMPNKRNLNPVLIQLQELSEKGWELFDTGSTYVGGAQSDNPGYIQYHYYLRKKKQ